MFDSRLTLARPDLAARRLEGVLRADRYAEPARMQCTAPVASIRRAPAPDAEQVDQLIFGEAFDVLDEADGFAWGQARRDGYVGHVLVEALSAPVLAPTHTVKALRTYAFAGPDVRGPIVGLYSLNALLTVEAREGPFVRAARSGWFHADHLRLVGEPVGGEPVAVAERFTEAPYQWGGRESLGLDCSALVQQSLYATGAGCPRDADMQAPVLGGAVEPDALQRGDLVFWAGHVAWMLDAERALHANSHAMAVTAEPLAEVEARIEARGDGRPTAYRRL